MDKKEEVEDSDPGLWKDFSESTGFHGLNKMTFDKNYPGRLIRSVVWSVVWLASAAVLIYIIITEFLNYYSYPSLSSTYLRFDQKLQFPVVTICTSDPMDMDTVSLYFDQSFVDDSEEIPVVRYTDFYSYETAYMCGCVCRRFNANEKFVTSRYGLSYGLLFKTTSTELQIAVHDRREEPNMVRDGRTVRNGTKTFIEIHRREYISLPSPFIAYGDQICKDNTDYSFVDCKRECYNELLKKECSCTMDPSTGNEPYCVDDYYTNTCAAELYGAATESSTTCVCPPECKFIKYDQVFSSVANLRDGYDHYLNIQIFFKDLSTTVTEQVPKYDGLPSLLANLGGQMGLFLGASILTMTELFEFLIFIIWTVFQRRANRKNVVKNTY